MTLVLGYDGTEPSHRALGVALDLAGSLGDSLVVVYGAEPPGGMGEEFKAHEAALLEIGEVATKEAVVRAESAHVAVEVILAKAKPAQALVDAANARDARMIIVGSRGESRLRGALLGSTVQRVLQLADQPVLVV